VAQHHQRQFVDAPAFPVAAATNGSGASGSTTPVIYAGVSDSGAAPSNYASLYRSVDGGSTWQAVPGAPTGLYVTHGVFGPDGVLYLSYDNVVGPQGITGEALWKFRSERPRATSGSQRTLGSITRPTLARVSPT